MPVYRPDGSLDLNFDYTASLYNVPPQGEKVAKSVLGVPKTTRVPTHGDSTIKTSFNYGRNKEFNNPEAYPGYITDWHKKAIEQMDLSEYISMFSHENIPSDRSSIDIARALYYAPLGYCMIFWDDIDEQIRIMPVSQESVVNDSPNTDDGLPKYVYPVPLSGSGVQKGKMSPGQNAKVRIYQDMKRKVLRSLPLVNSKEEALKIAKEYCVLIYRRAPGLIGVGTNRPKEIEHLIHYQWETLIQTKVAMLNSSGFQLIDVDVTANSTEQTQAILDMTQFEKLYGSTWKAFPGSGIKNAQSIQSTSSNAIEDMWAHYKAIDALRQQTLGFPNPGVYQKNTYQSLTELGIQNVISQSPYLEQLKALNDAYALANAVFGTAMYCRPTLLELQMQEQGADASAATGGDSGGAPANTQGGKRGGK